jgi:hypothetical protein
MYREDGHTEMVIVVVTDGPLNQLLSSGTLIAATWPHANEDVRVLVTLLQVTFPTLAEVLGIGLVTLSVANIRTSEISLSSGAATVRALAQSQDGVRVTDPKQHPGQVFRLDIVDVEAEGCSAAKVAR